MLDSAPASSEAPAARAFEVRGSHRTLLEALEPLSAVGDVTGRGLVMMPAARADSRLTTGTELARGLGWPLLVMCSHGISAPTVRERMRSPDLALTAADLISSDGIRAARSWSAVRHRGAVQRAGIDTSRKRNLALSVGAMVGKRWVLFIDDDLLGLSLGSVETALSHLGRRPDHQVVGWPYPSFPDNSVVHHARRDVMRWEQDVFLGGGALLVDVDNSPPAPFPPIYNEDWLFLFDALADGAVVAGPPIGQLPYEPYADPCRAGLEEFGDVLGEGLFHLLHEDQPVADAADPAYWEAVLTRRRKLLGRITERAREQSASGNEAQLMRQVVAAMTEARRQHTWVTEDALADFVRRWRQDLETWADFYERLPARETVKEALVYLGLHEAWIVTSGPSV